MASYTNALVCPDNHQLFPPQKAIDRSTDTDCDNFYPCGPRVGVGNGGFRVIGVLLFGTQLLALSRNQGIPITTLILRCIMFFNRHSLVCRP